MAEIKKIGVLSLAKMLAVLYAFFGFIAGGIATLVSTAGFAFSSGNSGIFGMLFGVGAIVLLPIFYGAMGFVSGIIVAALYNVISSKVGGIELELE